MSIRTAIETPVTNIFDNKEHAGNKPVHEDVQRHLLILTVSQNILLHIVLSMKMFVYSYSVIFYSYR